jgi:hypothetical protein
MIYTVASGKMSPSVLALATTASVVLAAIVSTLGAASTPMLRGPPPVHSLTIVVRERVRAPAVGA